jgi:hypothetical protein
VVECLRAEGQQVELHAGREVARPLREVGPPEGGRHADRRFQVRDKGDVQHFLDGDAAQLLAPPVDGVGLLGGQAIADAVLEAELCEQVLAHDHVLELQRLGQQPPQVFPVCDDDPRLGHGPQFTRSLCQVPHVRAG